MKNIEFINKNIGNIVYLTETSPTFVVSTFGKYKQLHKYTLDRFAVEMSTKSELRIVKMTKAGLALLKDKHNNFYSVPPRMVREVSNYPDMWDYIPKENTSPNKAWS